MNRASRSSPKAASLGLRIALPPTARHFAGAARSRMARLAALQPVLAAAVGLAAVAGLVAGVVWLAALHGRPGALSSLPSLPRLADLPIVGKGKIEGQAAVLSGDVFRLGTTVVRLADIEAPERCVRPESDGGADSKGEQPRACATPSGTGWAARVPLSHSGLHYDSSRPNGKESLPNVSSFRGSSRQMTVW